MGVLAMYELSMKVTSIAREIELSEGTVFLFTIIFITYLY